MENENVELEPVQNESVAENDPVPPTYFYSPSTREVFPTIFRATYEENGTWPEDGFEVPASVAEAYIQSESRHEQEIVETGSDTFKIVGMQ